MPVLMPPHEEDLDLKLDDLCLLQTLLLRGVLEWGREMDAGSDGAPVATLSRDQEGEASSNEVQ